MTVKHHNLWVPGFTLIELLVVISSISLLLGVLLPALGTARKQTYSVVCRSQIRQLGIASLGYAQESDGHFVPAARDMGQGNDDLYRWHGRRPSRNAAFDPNGSPLIAYLQEGQIKECPARVDFLATSDWNSSFEKGCGGYGYNMSYLGSRLWDKRYAARFKESYQNTTSLREVKRPSHTLMFADSAMTQDGENLIEYSFATPPPCCVRRSDLCRDAHVT
ncbi:MAG: prepilin-type N-terminal cleavage/methylation domain-containing protein, partial [Phycisphaeraceae bacterium]|nr:prepilin-type N-terminal cleavage/methylation domain-containing protein [Phycisphaeraceae bacterium]